MTCPYCGKEMRNGFIQSAREIFWSPTKKKVFFRPFKSDDVPVAPSGWNSSVAGACYCDNCRKIVIDC